MTARPILWLPLLVAAASCAQAIEGRIAANLTEAGLPAGMSRCMAEIWAERLNVTQLRKISSLASDLKAEGRSLTVGRLIGRVGAVNDLEILEVVTTSSARCAFSR